MTFGITIEDRLEVFAQGGLTCGFTLRLWDSKAKALEKKGIILRNPKPTGRKGEKSYEIDFSIPVPGSYSEELYEIAMANRQNVSKESNTVDPIPVPYSSD